MAVNMSIRQMKLLADKKWNELNEKEQRTIKSHEVEKIGQFCKYGYTQYCLCKTCLGLVFVAGYCNYCDIISSL